VFRGTEVAREERARIIRRHAELIDAYLPPRTALIQLKKHLAWYASGFPHAARLREEIFQAEERAAVHDVFWAAW